MVDGIAPVSKPYFPPGTIPAGSEDFYHDPQVLSNLKESIRIQGSRDDKATKAASDKWKETAEWN